MVSIFVFSTQGLLYLRVALTYFAAEDCSKQLLLLLSPPPPPPPSEGWAYCHASAGQNTGPPAQQASTHQTEPYPWPGLGPVISKWSLLSLSSSIFASLPLAGWFQTINSINPCLSGDLLLMTLRMVQSKSWLWAHSDISREAGLVSFSRRVPRETPTMPPYLFLFCPHICLDSRLVPEVLCGLII